MDRRIVFAVLHMLAATSFVGYLATSRTFPSIVVFFLFAVPYVWIEIHSAEVNDKLQATSGAMVLLSAGVFFGPENAALGMAAMPALWPFVPADFRERRVFLPALNLTQMIISGGLAGLTLEVLLPAGDPTDDLVLVSAASIAAAIVYITTNLFQVRLIVRVALGQTPLMPWTDMSLIVLWQAAMGAIGGMLGATLLVVGIVLLPVFFVIYLIGQLAWQSFADLRQAHDSTVRGFIKTLEAKDMFVHGHTARVASFAAMIGTEMGFEPRRMERIRWAALMHDVGAVAVPRDLLRNRRSLTDEEQAQLLKLMETVEGELVESDFLRPMMERAARLRMRFSESPEDEVTADAQVLAVAKWFDSVTNTRNQGQALTQEKALAQMRAESPYRYDPEVVEAFTRALASSGFEYGAVDFDNSRTAEDYAKEAMYDR